MIEKTAGNYSPNKYFQVISDYFSTPFLSDENIDLVFPKNSDPHIGHSQTDKSMDEPHFIRDGWLAGHITNTAAVSDDLQSQYCNHGGGLAAVLTNELTGKLFSMQ